MQHLKWPLMQHLKCTLYRCAHAVDEVLTTMWDKVASDANQIRRYHRNRNNRQRNETLCLQSCTIGLLGLSHIALFGLFLMMNGLPQHELHDPTRSNTTQAVMWPRKSGPRDQTYHSLHWLNSTLFCPLISDRDQKKFEKPLQYIHRLQFGAATNSPKFFLHDNWKMAGEGSVMEGVLSAFSTAMALKRTFLEKTDTFRWLRGNGSDVPICEGRRNRNCVLFPHSVFDDSAIRDIQDRYNSLNQTLTLKCEDVEPLQNGSMTLREFREMTDRYPLIINKCARLNPSTLKLWVDDRARGDSSWSLQEYEWLALAESFLLRFRDNVREHMDGETRQILDRYRWTGSAQTIALPIRRSDKCGKEMDCPPLNAFAEIVKDLKAKHPEISAVIVTSEDQTVLDWAKKHLNVPGVVTMFNDFDLIFGTGDPRAYSKKVDAIEGVAGYISMWQTFKLQMNAKYYVVARRSNFLHQIFVVRHHLDCGIYENHEEKTVVDAECIEVEGKVIKGLDEEHRCLRENFMLEYNKKPNGTCWFCTRGGHPVSVVTNEVDR